MADSNTPDNPYTDLPKRLLPFSSVLDDTIAFYPRIARHSGVSSALVYGAVERSHQEMGNRPIPCHALSRETGLSAATVRRAISSLYDNGWISFTRTKRGFSFNLLADSRP